MRRIFAVVRRLATTLDAGSSLIEIVFALVIIIGATSAARYTFWETVPPRDDIVEGTILVILAWSVIDAFFTLIGAMFQLGRERKAARAAGEPVPPIRFGPDAWWTVAASFCATSIALWLPLVPFALPLSAGPVLWASNAIAVAELFLVGWFWARWTDFPRWLCGVALAVVGIGAVAITVALGVA